MCARRAQGEGAVEGGVGSELASGHGEVPVVAHGQRRGPVAAVVGAGGRWPWRMPRAHGGCKEEEGGKASWAGAAAAQEGGGDRMGRRGQVGPRRSGLGRLKEEEKFPLFPDFVNSNGFEF